MYPLFLSSVFSAALLVAPGNAQQLFAAHSDGNVSTLVLTGSGNASSLSVTSVSSECRENPATLNLDSSQRILYCLDRGRNAAVGGSLNSFSIDSTGNLTRIDRVSAPFSGVTAEFFDVPGTGVRGYVSAS